MTQPKTICNIEMPAADVDFGKTYTFEVKQDGHVWQWTGASPERRGDTAVFDWQNGANGLLMKMSEALHHRLR